LVVRKSSRPNLLPLLRGKQYRIRILGSDTVPDVLSELDALGYGKAMEVGAGLAHKRQYIRIFFRRLTPELRGRPPDACLKIANRGVPLE
jgi:hypothetical protein